MKRNLIIMAVIALAFSNCRNEADYHPYIGEYGPLAYDSYTSQFEHIWKTMSTGYVFWDIETTDWDAVYDDLIPEFEKLDTKHNAGEDVYTTELTALYKKAFGSMCDHHMTVYIKNIFPSPSDPYQYIYVSPGNNEVEQRDYYIEHYEDEQVGLYNFLSNIETQYDISMHESAVASLHGEYPMEVAYHYCLINLPDGRKIPYLWQSSAAITPNMNGGDSTASAIIDHWLTAIAYTPREQLAGFILDNRANTGGYQDDMDYLLGSFINEKKEIIKTRYKEGPGRLEYSAWTPYYIYPHSKYHRDITAENIPYVIICDINSISMGEVEPLTIKSVLPTSYIIGERTYGATCGLQMPERINLNYGGPYGDYNNGHYVYTSTFECLYEGMSAEGIGCIPDKTVLRKDHNGDFKAQIDAAIEYIQSCQ